MQSVDLPVYTYNIQYSSAIDVGHLLYVCHLSDWLKYTNCITLYYVWSGIGE